MTRSTIQWCINLISLSWKPHCNHSQCWGSEGLYRRRRLTRIQSCPTRPSSRKSWWKTPNQKWSVSRPSTTMWKRTDQVESHKEMQLFSKTLRTKNRAWILRKLVPSGGRNRRQQVALSRRKPMTGACWTTNSSETWVKTSWTSMWTCSRKMATAVTQITQSTTKIRT